MHSWTIRMTTRFTRLALLFVSLLLSFAAAAKSGYDNSHSNTYYRTFWHPTYQGMRADWCVKCDKKCGKPAADLYCQRMGYIRAVNFTKDYDIGDTRYQGGGYCKGIMCDGFLRIKCLQKHNTVKAQAYYKRKRVFYFPSFDGYRIDYCYSTNKQCGHRPANSYCKRLGYAKTVGYKVAQAGVTRTLGKGQMCTGINCRSYQSITCYR